MSRTDLSIFVSSKYFHGRGFPDCMFLDVIANEVYKTVCEWSVKYIIFTN